MSAGRHRTSPWAPRVVVGLVVAALALAAVATTALVRSDPAAALPPAPAAGVPSEIGPDRLVREWESRGRPARLIVLKAGELATVQDGRPGPTVSLPPGPVSLRDLETAAPSGWITRTGQATRVAATVAVNGGTLEMTGPRRVELVSSRRPGGVASVHTGGGGRTTVRGAAVGAVDPGTGRPPDVDGARPALTVSAGGRLDVLDSTMTGLGATPGAAVGARPALEYRLGATGSVVRSRLNGSGTGLALMRSVGVTLDGVTVSGSRGDGVVLGGDRGTRIRNLTSDRNRGNGVTDTGDTPDRVLGPLATSGNGEFGLAIAAAQRPRITGLQSTGNADGALRLSRVRGGSVSGVTSRDEPAGIFLNFNTEDTTVTAVRAVATRRPVMADTTTRRLTVRDVDVRQASGTAVSIGSQGASIDGLRVDDSASAVRVEHGAEQIRLAGVTVTRGIDGIVAAAGSSRVSLSGLTASDLVADAVRSESPGLTVSAARIQGGHTGLDLGAAMRVSDVLVEGAVEAVHARGPGLVEIERLRASTSDRGVTIVEGTPVTLLDSQVAAPRAVVGELVQLGRNDLALPPVGLIAAVGGPLVLLAVALEAIHLLVGRRRRRATPPGLTRPDPDRPDPARPDPARPDPARPDPGASTTPTEPAAMVGATTGPGA